MAVHYVRDPVVHRDATAQLLGEFPLERVGV
jgi:hypothetical protein